MGWNDWVRGAEIELLDRRGDRRLGDQLESLLRAGARIFQFDVGDGHFVEPITIGPIVLKSISRSSAGRWGLDCHLMVEKPESTFRRLPRRAATASPCTSRPATTYQA